MKYKAKSFFILMLAALAASLLSCRIAKERPILKLPDGDRDRMLKKAFSGDELEPKYWIYKVTAVETSFGDYSDMPIVLEGMQSQTKLGYFEFTRDKLKFNNAVTRKILEEPDVAVQGLSELINEWPIKHFDVRLAEVDGYTTNREEENKYIPWSAKAEFTVDWSKANVSENGSFPHISYFLDCWKKKTAALINSSRHISKDYISWTIAVEYEQNPQCSSLKRRGRDNYTTTVHYKYSFKQAEDPRINGKEGGYKPYIYDGESDPLIKKYGYFRTVRPSIAENGQTENIFYMNRWDPNKKHIFYFTEDYPEEYKDIAHGAICHVNKLFAKHKLNNYPLNGRCKEDGSALPGKKETCSSGICFELRENTGQKFGDIRYSFFHLLKSHINTLGYGPSDTHPATGEIIAGNVVVSVYMLDWFLEHLVHERYKRNHDKFYGEDGKLIENNKIKYETSSLFEKMKETLKEKDHRLWTETSELIGANSKIRPDFEYLLSKLTYVHPAFSGFTNSESLFENGLDNFIFSSNSPSLSKFMPPLNLIEQSKKIIRRHQENLKAELSHERLSTVYPAEPVMAQLPGLLAMGLSPEEIKRRILFELITHEFGHVLNLRHNFYGSVDERHWAHDEESGEPVLKSSSVMDYRRIYDSAAGPPRSLFGAYDEAALVYAYSGGAKDLSKERGELYLYCSDESVYSNFLCNRWDRGSSPSEVMMSLIESYEESYFVRNLRAGRAYWSAGYYPGVVFEDMLNMKQALMMLATAFNSGNIRQILSESAKSYDSEEINFIINQTQKDVRQAIKLNMAFYNSTLQLSRADRDWQNFYNESSGSIERIGIFWDKLFAMLFLMGDAGFLYNPNFYFSNASYLTFINQLGFRQMIEEIMENTLTDRVDMENWFIGFARLLYAENASNFYNISGNGDLLEKIAVRCYTPKGLKDRFGIDPYKYKAREDSPEGLLDTAIIDMEAYLDKITDPYYYGTNERLGITFFDDAYYIASSNLNKYSFAIIEKMKRELHSAGASLRLAKQDVYDLFYLYNLKKRGDIPPACDNGD